MIQRVIALLLLVGLLPLAPAAAQPVPQPVCARQAVLQRVDEILHEAGRELTLDPAPIGEISITPGRLVRCAVRGHIIGYDTNRYGLSPLHEPIIVNYTIELRQNGMFVHVD